MDTKAKDTTGITFTRWGYNVSANRFGHLFQITSFGESHGTALGVVIEGCPAGLVFNFDLLKQFLERRRPGNSATVTGRQESDATEILSGVYDGKTLGTPITIIVRNNDARSSDYDQIKTMPRAGHADDVWREKFEHTDPRGGGRSSGRETVARVMGGAVAQMLVQANFPQTQVVSFPRQIGNLHTEDTEIQLGQSLNLSTGHKQKIDQMLLSLKSEGDSVGGIAEIWVPSPPKSLGQPVFHKLKADLAAAYMSIGATTGVELGGGFDLAERRGTEVHAGTGSSEVYGGIRGGITTGEKLILRVAFKPTSSILDIAKKGRHDPCIIIRALPVLEAMTWLVLADHILWRRLDPPYAFS
jgi:chorismate synthase